MALGSHFLLDVKVGAYTESDSSLSSGFDGQLPDHCVLMVDRGRIDYGRFYRHQQRGEERHWLVRAKSNLVWTVLEILGPNEVIAEVPFRRPARRSDPTLPSGMRIRVICYQLLGLKPHWLLTSMLDAERYPAAEITRLYHQCWELETGFDELHTHPLERLEALRSQTPDRIRQELFALAVMYNLVRLEMARVADQQQAGPDVVAQCVGGSCWSSASGSGATDGGHRLARSSCKKTSLVPPSRQNQDDTLSKESACQCPSIVLTYWH